MCVEHLQLKEEHWVIADLVGKGGRIRIIPVPDWVKAGTDAWIAAGGITTGTLFRSINTAGRIWGRLLPQGYLGCSETESKGQPDSDSGTA